MGDHQILYKENAVISRVALLGNHDILTDQQNDLRGHRAEITQNYEL